MLQIYLAELRGFVRLRTEMAGLRFGLVGLTSASAGTLAGIIPLVAGFAALTYSMSAVASVLNMLLTVSHRR